MDPRWKQVGEVLVTHSTEVQPGERVMIAMIEPETFPLALATYEAVIKADGLPQIQMKSERLRHAVLRHGNDTQINWVPEIETYGMEWADVYIGLRGGHNLYELADVPPDKLAANQAAMGKVSSMRWEHTRWVLTRVPNEAFAQQAETDLETILDMYFDACLLDYVTEGDRWQAQAHQLEGTSEVRIVGEGTDLRFSVLGRKWLILDGKINMPDGEIFTAPVTSSIHGVISFDFPGVLSGRLMHNIRLEWNQGVLVKAEASTNNDFLQKIVSSDEGSSLIGEFAFGTNPHVDRFSKDILLDEKIGGTVHIALGRAYPECGGKNQSAIHWDIVKDLRKEGFVEIDGKRVLEHGKLTI